MSPPSASGALSTLRPSVIRKIVERWTQGATLLTIAAELQVTERQARVAVRAAGHNPKRTRHEQVHAEMLERGRALYPHRAAGRSWAETCEATGEKLANRPNLGTILDRYCAEMKLPFPGRRRSGRGVE